MPGDIFCCHLLVAVGSKCHQQVSANNCQATAYKGQHVAPLGRHRNREDRVNEGLGGMELMSSSHSTIRDIVDVPLGVSWVPFLPHLQNIAATRGSGAVGLWELRQRWYQVAPAKSIKLQDLGVILPGTAHSPLPTCANTSKCMEFSSSPCACAAAESGLQLQPVSKFCEVQGIWHKPVKKHPLVINSG